MKRRRNAHTRLPQRRVVGGTRCRHDFPAVLIAPKRHAIRRSTTCLSSNLEFPLLLSWDNMNCCANLPTAAYESWPAATGPQPVAAPLVKKVKPVKTKGAGGEGSEEVEVEVEKDEGEATPEGNKRLLADILSVRARTMMLQQVASGVGCGNVEAKTAVFGRRCGGMRGGTKKRMIHAFCFLVLLNTRRSLTSLFL